MEQKGLSFVDRTEGTAGVAEECWAGRGGGGRPDSLPDNDSFLYCYVTCAQARPHKK